MTSYDHAFGQISGLELEESACIALRWETGAPFGVETGESHVFEMDANGIHASLATPGRFVGLWRGASGEVHVAHEDGVLYSRMVLGQGWRAEEVDAALAGVWGLDATGEVYAWGLGLDRGAAVYKRDPAGHWDRIASPEEPILELHGVRPDLLVGVGLHGGIHFLENSRWRRVASPVRATLASIFVVSDDEMYACGPGSKYMLEGSIHGWTRRGPLDRTLYRAVKHGGQLWVGCGRAGLHRLAPGATELEKVRSDLAVSHLDARRSLLVSDNEEIASVEPGGGLQFEPLDGFIDIVAHQPPTWRP